MNSWFFFSLAWIHFTPFNQKRPVLYLHLKWRNTLGETKDLSSHIVKRFVNRYHTTRKNWMTTAHLWPQKQFNLMVAHLWPESMIISKPIWSKKKKKKFSKFGLNYILNFAYRVNIYSFTMKNIPVIRTHEININFLYTHFWDLFYHIL